MLPEPLRPADTLPPLPRGKGRGWGRDEIRPRTVNARERTSRVRSFGPSALRMTVMTPITVMLAIAAGCHRGKAPAADAAPPAIADAGPVDAATGPQGPFA